LLQISLYVVSLDRVQICTAELAFADCGA